MKYIQIIKETFLPNYISSMFLMLSQRPWRAGVPWSIHFPPPLFPNWFGSHSLPETGTAPGLSWHDVITSHDMTCHHHLPAPSSQSRFQHDQYWPQPCEHLDKLKGFMSPGKLLCKYSANIVSCSHAWYLYGRWAPVECDLCEGLSYWSSPFCLNVK